MSTNKARPIGEFGKIGSKQGLPDAVSPSYSDVQTFSSPIIQETKRTDDRKRQTVYLPADLAKWLKIHAIEIERDMSEIVTDLVREYQSKENQSTH